MANTIITKNSSTASSVPTSGDLVQGELAVNVTDKRLFTENASGTVVELGTNPTTIAVAGNATVGGTLGVTGVTTLAGASVTSLTNSGSTTLSGGTANGVTYLNGSKALTSGSALTFDGSTFNVTGTVVSDGLTVAASDVTMNDASGEFKLILEGTSAPRQNYIGVTGYDSLVLAADEDNLGTDSDIRFRIDASEKMRLTSTGLGIGTSSPAVKLDVNGSVRLPDGYEIGFGATNTAYWLGDSANNWHRWFTGNTERMRLTSTGLGIGTSSPSYKLDVAKSATGLLARFTGLNNAVAVYTDSTLGGFSDSTGQYGLFNVYSGGSATATTIWTANAERLRIDSSGNLGLGVTPSAWEGAYYSAFQFGNQGASLSAWKSSLTASKIVYLSNNLYQTYTGGVGPVDRYVSDGPSIAYRLADGEHQWFSASNGAAGNAISFNRPMTLDASGNLLVGTTTPIYNTTGAGSGFEFNSAGYLSTKRNTTTTAGHIVFHNPNGIVGQILTSGSSTSYNTSSDYRLKEDWQPMTGASERVKALKPVNFAWKADGSRVDGFLAHEAQAVVPEAVTGEKNAVDADGKPVYQGIDQSKLVPLLTASLQEALAEIESLKARLDAANL